MTHIMWCIKPGNFTMESAKSASATDLSANRSDMANYAIWKVKLQKLQICNSNEPAASFRMIIKWFIIRLTFKFTESISHFASLSNLRGSLRQTEIRTSDSFGLDLNF